MRLTARAGHAGELAHEALAEGCGLVVAVGGDGTINEVAAALIGTTLDDKALAAMQAAATAAAQPITDRRGTVEFRKDVTAVLAARTARIAYARAKGAVK